MNKHISLLSKYLFLASQVLIFIMFFFFETAQGGLFRVESETLLSSRNKEAEEVEHPFYEFFNAAYESKEKTYRLNSSFTYNFDFKDQKNSDTFNLYLMDLEIDPYSGKLVFKMGRTFNLQHSYKPIFMEELSIGSRWLNNRVYYGGFIGKEAMGSEVGDWSYKNNTQGVFANYQSDSLTPLFLSLKLQNTKEIESLKSQDSIRLSANQSLLTWGSPQILFDTEYLPQSNKERWMEFGVDFYFGLFSTLSVRKLNSDTHTTLLEDNSLQSVFSLGPINETSLSWGYRINPIYTTSLLIGWTDYLLEERSLTHGQKYAFNLAGQFSRIDFANDIFYFQSYGGTVYGEHLDLNISLSNKIKLESSLQAAYYDKVTGSSRWAFSTQIGASTWFLENYKLNMGFEINNNNRLQYELRFMTQLIYWLWRET
jgi:hypothetical protein